ncbi:MAG TPA: BrnT family toxin [Rubrobacter sp.]
METLVEFEFDETKSRTNKDKHGIDFVKAQALWLDETFVEIPARTVDELRFVVVGVISGKHWSAVITYRGERVRIISVRRSRTEEVEIYES